MNETAVEALLRAQGLTEERLGPEEWARTVREAMDYEAEKAARPTDGRRASQDPSLTTGTSRPPMRSLRPVSSLLNPAELGDIRAGLHERLERRRAANDALGGERAASEDDGPPCKLCDGARFVRVTVDLRHPLFGVSVPCTCVGSFGIGERIARAAIPARYEAMAFNTFGGTDNIAALRSVTEWAGLTNMLIIGEPGRGKTHLAVAALRREVEERGKVGRFFYVPHLLEDVRRRYGDGESESAQAFTDSLVGWPLLVLDDLGAERVTPWAQEQLDGLIERRLSAGMVTVITTNLDSVEAIRVKLGARIASRLGPGVYDWVEVAGPDMREFVAPGN